MTTARDQLYNQLTEVLGDTGAQTLMELLPPDKPDDLATTTDIVRLETRIGEGFDRLDQRMDGLEQRMDGLELGMDRFERRMDRSDDRMDDFHAALREQTRTFVLASTSSTVLVASLAFAAASLV